MKALAARDGDAVRSSFVASAHGDSPTGIAEFAKLIESEFEPTSGAPGARRLDLRVLGHLRQPAGQQAMQTAQDEYGNDGVAPSR